ncbi:MAG TPA: outer membrane beta-barrel protein, partial [Steroidobacteraceae bacterium]|nr:outer membrane beta-barrel protein [Steroidobacteraceae bacterium]
PAAPAQSPGSPPPPPPRPAVAAAPPVVMQPLQPSRPELRYRPFTFQIDGGYSVTTAPTNQYLDGGPNAGFGFSWFPSAALPIGLRVDGSYNWFRAKDALLNPGNFNSGHENFYGGDADLQLNLARNSSSVQIYLFGGAGWYREETVLRQISWVNGVVCDWDFCGPGYFPAVTAEQRSTSDWHHAWNAGVGIEFPIADRASFFLEARYLRILPNSDQMKFVPIRVGLRF